MQPILVRYMFKLQRVIRALRIQKKSQKNSTAARNHIKLKFKRTKILSLRWRKCLKKTYKLPYLQSVVQISRKCQYQSLFPLLLIADNPSLGLESAYVCIFYSSFYILVTPQHYLQTGLQNYSPPISQTCVQSTVLFVNAAYFPQSIHTADNLVTFSAKGTKDKILPKGFLWNVPSKADTITTTPWFARCQAYSAISGKKWPQSIATMSQAKALDLISLRLLAFKALMVTLLITCNTYHEQLRHHQMNIYYLCSNSQPNTFYVHAGTSLLSFAFLKICLKTQDPGLVKQNLLFLRWNANIYSFLAKLKIFKYLPCIVQLKIKDLCTTNVD